MNARITNGDKGGIYIGDTASYTPAQPNVRFMAVQILADAVLDAATACNIVGLAGGGTTLPAGIIIFGTFSLVKLVSGAAIAYNG